MAEYSVASIDSKHFSLKQNDTVLGVLHYLTWYSFKAEIKLANNSVYQIEPKGFWGTTIELKELGQVLLDFKMNWSGSIEVNSKFNGVEKHYLFKHKGILNEFFILLDSDETELLTMKPDFKWKKLKTDYEITTSAQIESLYEKDILLMVLIHCANYYMSMMHTVVAT